MVVGTGFGILSPLWGQTGTPAAATAPGPSVSVMPEAAPSKAKAPMPFDKARGRQSKKSAIQETTPAPTQSRRNAAARSMRGQGPAVSYADAVKRQHRQRH